MQVLITGAAGFIGRSLCGQVLRHGHGLIALARYWSSTAEYPGSNLVAVDLTTPLDAALADYRPDAIIHLAGRAHQLNDTAPDPLAEFRRVNCDATLALARWAADANVRRFVYVSSIGVNGNATRPGTPFTEESPAAPHDLYAISKHEAELALQELAQRTGMELCIVRPPLVYGPDAPGNFGRLVRLLQTGLPLPLGGIDNRRSFIYVENLADALLRCATLPAASGQLFLVSDGRAVSTPELLRLMAAATGRRARLFSAPLAMMRLPLDTIGKADVLEKLTASLEVDDTHIRQTLGWQPPFELGEGLARTFCQDRTAR